MKKLSKIPRRQVSYPESSEDIMKLIVEVVNKLNEVTRAYNDLIDAVSKEDN